MNSSESLVILALVVPLLTGCGDKESKVGEDGRFKIVFQTDWYPQPEQGGFYQALVEGYYEEEGLDVEILQGGPNAVSLQKVMLGQADFSMGKTNDLMMHAARGVPIVMIGAHLQHDPQALLFHQENPIHDFRELDGKRIMYGAGSAFLELIRRKYDIDFDVIPLDYGIGQFLRDKDFIQQCFITSEPYFARKQGANPGAILIRESGFDPYHVWYARADFVQKHPEIVKKFNRATIKGWQNYLFGERTQTDALLKSLNPKLDDEFIEYSIGALIEYGLVTGLSGESKKIGTIDPDRVQTEINQLTSLDLLKQPINLEDILWSSSLTEAGHENSPADSGELEIISLNGSDPGPETLRISYNTLASLPKESRPFQFTQNEDPLSAKVVYLDAVLEKVGFKPNDFVLLANCGDKYQSNFGPATFDSLEPYIVIEIEDQPTYRWAESKDNPGWGPYIIGIANETGLKDPASKQPWGVVNIELMPSATFEAALNAKWPETLSVNAQHGRRLFLNNCLNCHALNETIGGNVSTRTVQILSIHAQSNPSYVRQMIYEPEKAYPDGIKMPAMPHYSEEDVQAVVDFLLAYKE